MTTRHYNLKLGKKEVFGGVLTVDTDKSLEKRVQDGNHSADWMITLLRHNSRGALYKVALPDGEYVNAPGRDQFGGRIGVPVRVDAGTDVVHVHVNPQGLLTLAQEPRGKRAYLSEIDKKKAHALREQERCWDLQRAYVYE